MSIAGKLPRRQFLQIGLGAATLATVHTAFAAKGDAARRTVDVAIVGAGLAGLTAARLLVKSGLSVCVLEARDRVGGRNFDQAVVGSGGAVAEGGGQWVGPGQDRVLALARGLGIQTFESYRDGKMTLSFGGRRFTVGSDHESAELQRIKALLDKLANDVSTSTPWTAPKAAEWDATTLGQWLKQNTKDQEAIETFTLDCETELGSPDDISLLWYLFYVRSAGGHKALNVDAQRWRFVGGPQQLSQRMAKELGDRVVLAAPVKRVRRTDEAVEVESDAVVCTAKHVVIAMMPADTRRIAFEPELPADRVELARAWKGESAVKVNAVYPKPFWRDKGLSGLGVCDKGPVGVTFDNSPPDGSRGVLLAFLSDTQLPKDPATRKSAVLKQFAELFGKAAAEPTAYIETDWAADGWSSGCVSPIGLGVLTRSGPALRTPVGRVHWAGTETSEIWCGYMDGAVRSGERVAAELIDALK